MTWISPGIEVSNGAGGWQAMMAWQICLRPYKEWINSRWGFNASVLLEEALDRLKLFIESQYVIDFDFQVECRNQRSVVLRSINYPQKGLSLGLLGKIYAASEQQIYTDALAFGREMESVFPHDFFLHRASTEQEFRQVNGSSILDGTNLDVSIVAIRRGDVFVKEFQTMPRFSGFWQASTRSSEQIWRALAGTDRPSLFSVSLRPTVIYEQERQFLLEARQNVANLDKQQNQTSSLALYQSWAESYLKRRLTPWKKFFNLHVHVAMIGEMDESLDRKSVV